MCKKFADSTAPLSVSRAPSIECIGGFSRFTIRCPQKVGSYGPQCWSFLVGFGSLWKRRILLQAIIIQGLEGKSAVILPVL